MDTYKRLMEAEFRLEAVHRRAGVAKTMADALEAVRVDPTGNEQEDDLYLAALVRYVEALGGHVEVRAVFPDEAVTVLREPDEDAAAPLC
jgi:hypothetical protein